MKKSDMRRPILLAVFSLAAFVMGACDPKTDVKPVNNGGAAGTPTPASTQDPANSPEVANPNEAAVQQLIGRWNGPEGTYISITEKKTSDGKQQNPRKFEIEIANLDGPKKYDGTAKGPAIEFTRNGKTETIRSSSGQETGMKGYEKETNCVVVTKGSEGFCQKVDSATAPSPAASPSVK